MRALCAQNELLYSKKSGKKLRGCLLLNDFRVVCVLFISVSFYKTSPY